ncbi:hypothetical protein [Streptomyces sp. NPDC049949]|uniref:hypothetical protein n=1 Tax=Streptomyces sp. NPDC049949 TaxID=3154627 RepID=UPI0034364594
MVKNYGEFNKGDCLTRIVHDGAVKGYFTKSVESKQHAGVTKPFDFITWTPAKGNAAGAEQKSFYVVYKGADKIYMDSDEIPAGLPTCDAKVKGQSARKYRAKVRIYGEPRRDMKVFVRTWNEIEGFTATDSYFRPGDCIMLSGAAAKHDGKDVYETTGSLRLGHGRGDRAHQVDIRAAGPRGSCTLSAAALHQPSTATPAGVSFAEPCPGGWRWLMCPVSRARSVCSAVG